MDVQTPELAQKFPVDLRKWAGFTEGGVRRTFDDTSGRPNRQLIETRLLRELKKWAHDFAQGRSGPRVILLVGGPGNGKTEAAEEAVRMIERALSDSSQNLVERIKQVISPGGERIKQVISPGGEGLVPRSAREPFSVDGAGWSLELVPDASVRDASRGGTEAELLFEDLLTALRDPKVVYIACVNRGILDDALSSARSQGNSEAEELLGDINLAIALTPSSGGCWPLSDRPDVAVWPMDAESAFVKHNDGDNAPADQLFRQALDSSKWLPYGSCAGGVYCPFCTSRALLSQNDFKELGYLLKMLRWHELSSGKRWTFREIFSLVSYLLAGDPLHSTKAATPCDWAKEQEAEHRNIDKARTHRARAAIFRLASSQYHHMVMTDWGLNGRAFLKLLSDIQRSIKIKGYYLEREAPILYGLGAFLRDGHPHAQHVAGHIKRIQEILDPSYIDPNLVSAHSSDSRDSPLSDMRKIDVLCSEQSIRLLADMYKPVSDSDSVRFSKIDYDVLCLLAKADEVLSGLLEDIVEGAAVKSIIRAQKFIRYFASRYAKRSLWARSLLFNDAELFLQFEGLVDSGDQGAFQDSLHSIVKTLQSIINSSDRNTFEVSANTTFGQNALPSERAAHIISAYESVTVRVNSKRSLSGPDFATPFVDVEFRSAELKRETPFTYDLFQAVSLLDKGLMPESMSNDVVAMIDIIRGQVAGRASRRPLTDLQLRTRDMTDGPKNLTDLVKRGAR